MTEVDRAQVRRPLYAIVVAAVGLIVARLVWPGLVFDTTSLVLFAVAAIAWALAWLPVSRFKFGEYEIELEKSVEALKQKVSGIEAADRMAGELEQQALAAEAAAVERTGRTPARWEGRVMRGGPPEGPSGPRPAPEGSGFADEYRRIVGSAAPDEDRIARAVDLAERIVGQSADPAAAEVADRLRGVLAEVRARRVEVSPRLAGGVLAQVGRLILLQARTR